MPRSIPEHQICVALEGADAVPAWCRAARTLTLQSRTPGACGERKDQDLQQRDQAVNSGPEREQSSSWAADRCLLYCLQRLVGLPAGCMLTGRSVHLSTEVSSTHSAWAGGAQHSSTLAAGCSRCLHWLMRSCCTAQVNCLQLPWHGTQAAGQDVWAEEPISGACHCGPSILQHCVCGVIWSR